MESGEYLDPGFGETLSGISKGISTEIHREIPRDGKRGIVFSVEGGRALNLGTYSGLFLEVPPQSSLTIFSETPWRIILKDFSRNFSIIFFF